MHTTTKLQIWLFKTKPIGSKHPLAARFTCCLAPKFRSLFRRSVIGGRAFESLLRPIFPRKLLRRSFAVGAIEGRSRHFNHVVSEFALARWLNISGMKGALVRKKLDSSGQEALAPTLWADRLHSHRAWEECREKPCARIVNRLRCIL